MSSKIRSRIEASVLLSIETQQNSLTTISKKSFFQRCFGKKGDAESLVSDLIFLELRSLRSELHKEEKLLERHVLSNREINKRLLYLFQRDLLPGLQGEILDDKCRRDRGILVQTRSQVMQRMGWAFLMLLNGCMLFYVLLFAAHGNLFDEHTDGVVETRVDSHDVDGRHLEDSTQIGGYDCRLLSPNGPTTTDSTTNESIRCIERTCGYGLQTCIVQRG